MSFRILNIGINLLPDLIGPGATYLNIIEAAPHYAGYRIKFILTGTRVLGSTAADFSVDNEQTYLRVADVNGPDPILQDGDFDIGGSDAIAPGYCTFLLTPGVKPAFCHSPTYASFTVTPNATSAGTLVVGTYDDGVNPVDDIESTLLYGNGPTFAVADPIPANERRVDDCLQIDANIPADGYPAICIVNMQFELDISTLTRAQWRDFRDIVFTQVLSDPDAGLYDSSTVEGTMELEFFGIPSLDFRDPYNSQLLPLI